MAKLHAKDPGERYQSAREVAEVLANCEQQVKAHGSPRNDSLIPGRNPLRKREIKWWAWAAGLAIVLTAFFLLNRPRGDASLLEILPEQGLVSVIVLRNDEGVIDGDKLHTQMTDWLDMRKRQTLKLKPGMYQLNVGTFPMGTVVSRWEVTTSNRFGSERVWGPVQNSSAIITVERGSQVTLRPVMTTIPQHGPPTK